MQMGHSQKSPLKCKKLYIQPDKTVQTAVFARGAAIQLPTKGPRNNGGLNGLCQQVPLRVAMGTPLGLTKGIS